MQAAHVALKHWLNDGVVVKMKRIVLITLIVLSNAATMFIPGQARSSVATPSLPVYADALASGWQDWSYNSITHDYANSSPVHAGSASIAVTYSGGWSGLQ